MTLAEILKQVAAGTLSAEAALESLNSTGEINLGFARVDTDRQRRRGMPEVIFSASKTAAQVAAIAETLAQAGQNVFATRACREQYEAVKARLPGAVYHEMARAITVDVTPLPEPVGLVAVVTAGTTDIPVGEEAALTAERMGARVDRIFDVGVAGLHRLLRHVNRLRAARVLVVAAGMEGALPSVVGGLVSRPIIAVPTSIGYGANLKGIATLLAMLNTCVPGISVVNIDNGFGAGVAAAMINRTGEPDEPRHSPRTPNPEP
ncbi:MAG: nickel pincer cofactor biosynthesis protein LarB [Kiritimatiellia bacterium]